MNQNAFVTLVATALAAGTAPVQGWSEQFNTQDPVAVMEQLLRWQMEDTARQRAEAQRQRIASEREEAHDRQVCLRTGFRGPDLEQCVRDSASYRRTGSDFSDYGTPAGARRSRPITECVTLGDGLGGGITDCY